MFRYGCHLSRPENLENQLTEIFDFNEVSIAEDGV